MKKKTIAILGGGNGGHAAAVDLTLRGFEVRLYEDAAFASGMDQVFSTKEISYAGVLGEGRVRVSMVTSDMKEAVTGAAFIIVSVPAFAHKHFAKTLVPFLEDGQTVLIFAGIFGSLVFRKEMKDRNIKKEVVFAETHTLPYATRLIGPGQSMIMGVTNPLLTGVMPARKTGETMEILQPLYPVTPAKSVLDCGLFTLNPVVHVPGCILNAGRIELMQGEFWFYKEGITPGVGRVTEMVDAERMAIITKLGYTPEPLLQSLIATGSKGENIYEAITGNEGFAKIKGPDNFKNRYFTEDIPYGLVAWALLAKSLGVPTPVMDSLVTLANGLLEQNCWETGRNLEDLGIKGMDLDELHLYLEYG